MHRVRDLLAIQPVRKWPQRFWAKVDKSGECWLWTGARDWNGYGQTAIGHVNLRAHRVAYELERGPIPDGLTLDHLCRNPPCVNPSHLEPVTSGENTMRGDTPASVNAAKTHCPSGHPLSGDNLFSVSGRRNRRCRECHRIQTREGLRRLRARRRTASANNV